MSLEEKRRAVTEHEKRVAFIKHKALPEDDAAGFTAAMRELVIGAVIGWQGVTLQDLVPDAEAPVPVEFEASLVETLMDAQDDDACELANDLTTRILGRMKGLEESAKK